MIKLHLCICDRSFTNTYMTTVNKFGLLEIKEMFFLVKKERRNMPDRKYAHLHHHYSYVFLGESQI